MKLLILSDLHLEQGIPLSVPIDADYDVAVLAGDIHSPGTRAVNWAASESTFGGKPVIYVPGNHEFYGQVLPNELGAMRKAAEGTNVHVLSRSKVDIGDVRFLGATLWTDFALPVVDTTAVVKGHYEESNVEKSLAAANKFMEDFKMIEVPAHLTGQHRDQHGSRLLTAEDTLAMHHIDRDWLLRELGFGHFGPTVVVTHHAPHRRSVVPKYRSTGITPAYASDLPERFFTGEPRYLLGKRDTSGGPALWVHGHTHSALDYGAADCRVVSNPRGYRMRDGGWENAAFNLRLIVEV